ncbi:hypothetical protein HK103_000005 [Boothiomyces macroporosus]|uniref:Uncharacterized protein n=1 Tax=Boothiomyces macroporosus TaxID=261099 RepID=A0AAD5USG0_9FUNG|nr:hypothetical protein HK103_000005 [Boothiomyces macroporosus]
MIIRLALVVIVIGIWAVLVALPVGKYCDAGSYPSCYTLFLFKYFVILLLTLPSGFAWNDYISNEVLDIPDNLQQIIKSILKNVFDFCSYAVLNIIFVMLLMIGGVWPAPLYPLFSGGTYLILMPYLYYRYFIPDETKYQPGFLKKFFIYGQLFPALRPGLYFVTVAIMLLFTNYVTSSVAQIIFMCCYELILVPGLIYVANYTVKICGNQTTHLDSNHVFLLSVLAKFDIEVLMDMYYMFLFSELNDWYVSLVSILVSNLQILLELFHYEETTAEFYLKLGKHYFKSKKVRIAAEPHLSSVDVDTSMSGVDGVVLPTKAKPVLPAIENTGITKKPTKYAQMSEFDNTQQANHQTEITQTPKSSMSELKPFSEFSSIRKKNGLNEQSIASGTSSYIRMVDEKGRFIRIEYYVTSVLKRAFSCLFALCTFPLFYWGPNSRWQVDIILTNSQFETVLIYIAITLASLGLNILIASLYIHIIKRRCIRTLSLNGGKELSQVEKRALEKMNMYNCFKTIIDGPCFKLMFGILLSAPIFPMTQFGKEFMVFTYFKKLIGY